MNVGLTTWCLDAARHRGPRTLVQARLASMSIDDLDASLRRATTVASVDELLDT